MEESGGGGPADAMMDFVLRGVCNVDNLLRACVKEHCVLGA